LIIKNISDLPLHTGKCPNWLFKKMVNLSGNIAELIIDEYGKKEFFKRISNPYWFQAFGCVLGFDWHSSGLTTTTLAALKESLEKKNLGIYIAGGKGKYALNTPNEIAEKLNNKNAEKFIEISRLTAKIDNNLVQDNYNLYLHFFIFDEKNWAVIQQGLNESNNYARRYHWFNSENLLKEPHCGVNIEKIEEKTLILVKEENYELQELILNLKEESLSEIKNYLKQLKINKNQNLLSFLIKEKLILPRRHWIKPWDLSDRDLKYFKVIKELEPKDFKELLKIKGIGKKGIRALSLISSLVYGKEIDWKDFVKYSYAHGGKDGTPYPVNKKVYLNSIMNLKEIIENSKIKEREKENALKRLNKFLQQKISEEF